MNEDMRKYAAEFVGTFTLVFVGTAVATLQGFLGMDPAVGWIGICFAFGGTLMILAYVIGPVSGCHINPAVTIPMAISGRMGFNQVPGYIVAQFAGGAAASGVLFALLSGMPDFALDQHGLGANGNPKEMAVWALFGWEVVLTALFLFVIFSATRSDGPPGFAPIPIGGFLFVAHLIGAPLGDSSLNPARSLGPALFVRGDALSVLWVFIAAPVVGGILGWLLYRLVYTEE
jgi:aquaporin Z